MEDDDDSRVRLCVGGDQTGTSVERTRRRVLTTPSVSTSTRLSSVTVATTTTSIIDRHTPVAV